ncbi:MAG: diacylglycerol/polyprenol kinase family protein, partial [Candidatus Cloacimonadia bacterium]
HLGALIIPIGYYFVIESQLQTILILLPIALICIIIDSLRMQHQAVRKPFLQIFGHLLREQEVNTLTGASYLLTSSMVTIAIFPKAIAFFAISFLTVGDAFASIIGMKWGKRKIFGTEKTLEGFLGFFVSCTIYGVIFYYSYFKNLYNSNPLNPLIIIIIGALTAAVIEAVNLHINDNITIPILSGLAMSILYVLI